LGGSWKRKKIGPFWIQCDKCFKWRSVPKSPENYPDEWSCSDNINMHYSDCNIPQEKDKIFPDLSKGPAPPPKQQQKITEAEVQEQDKEEKDSQDPPYSKATHPPVAQDIQRKPPPKRTNKKKNSNYKTPPSNYKTSSSRKLPRNNSDNSDDEYDPTKADDYEEYEEYKPKRKSSSTEAPKKKKIPERELELVGKLAEVYDLFKDYTKKLSEEEIKNPSFWIEEWIPTSHFKNVKTILDSNDKSHKNFERRFSDQKIKKEAIYNKPKERANKIDHNDFINALFGTNE